MLKSRRIQIILTSLLSLLVCLLLFILLQPQSQDTKKPLSSAEKRYHEMLQNPSAYTHEQAHILGEDLFKEKGFDGIGVCDENFSYGCYHGFFVAAVAENGIEIAQKLDEACTTTWKEKSNPCLHGIGHGLLTFLGDEHLTDALETCAILPSFAPKGGCTSGVFMEYNFSNSDHSGETMTRTLKSGESILSPCINLPSKFKEGCWYEMSQWWPTALDNDYEKIVPLCLSLKNPDEKDSCIQGMGHYSGLFYHYDTDKVISLCKSTENLQNELNCRLGATFSYLSDPQNAKKAPELCEGLALQSKNSCLNAIYHNPFWPQGN